MRDVTGHPPKMWGTSLIGFGSYRYKYASGREGDWFLTGFSPRRRHLTIYIMSGFSDCGAILKRLGRHKTSKCCLHVKRLDDVDRGALAELVRRSVREVAKAHGAGAGK